MQPTQNTPDNRAQIAETATNDVVQTLRDVKLYIERHGWNQGEYYDATSGRFTPPACLVGAIGMVCYGGPVDAPAQHFDDPGFGAFEDAFLHLDSHLIHAYDQDVYTFNDARGRTVDEVLSALDAAAISDPSTWLPACCGRRMVTGSAYVRVYDRAEGSFVAERVYTCQSCDNSEWKRVTDPNEELELFTTWCAKADAAVHDGDQHEPGTDADCVACDEYCYCVAGRVCVYHADVYDDGEDTTAWAVDGAA